MVVLESEETPVPLNVSVFGESEPCVKITIDPDRMPNWVGVNVTVNVQLPPETMGAESVPQVFVCEKSPLAVMPVMFAVLGPLFVNVKVCVGLLRAKTILPKARLVGLSVAVLGVPVPVRESVSGLVEVLSTAKALPMFGLFEEVGV